MKIDVNQYIDRIDNSLRLLVDGILTADKRAAMISPQSLLNSLEALKSSDSDFMIDVVADEHGQKTIHLKDWATAMDHAFEKCKRKAELDEAIT